MSFVDPDGGKTKDIIYIKDGQEVNRIPRAGKDIYMYYNPTVSGGFTWRQSDLSPQGYQTFKGNQIVGDLGNGNYRTVASGRADPDFTLEGSFIALGRLLKSAGQAKSFLGKAKEESFFNGTRYTDKVRGQMKKGDNHSFPESVKTFEREGSVSTIKGGDGVTRKMLTIPGKYKGREGVFEFMKEADGSINHRFFRPLLTP